MDSIGHNSNGYQVSSCVGMIYIPKGVDRNKYVESCMRRGVCSVIRDNSFGVLENVKIDSEKIQLLEWPLETGILGDAVVLVLNPFKNQYSVVAVLNKDGNVLEAKEHTRHFSKQTENGRVSIDLDGQNVTVDVVSEGGDINLITRGGNLSIKSDREVRVESVGKVFVKTQEEVEIRYDDEETNNSLTVSKDLIKQVSPRIEHNAADQAMLRGDKTIDLLDDLLKMLYEARTATSIGLQPLNNFVKLNELRSKLNDLKSTKSFLE